MDWQTENSKDMRLLELRSLAPLDPRTVAGNADLAATIERHNVRTARVAARVGQSAEDRSHLADFEAWRDADMADIASQRSRVRRELWEALRELRQVLEERQAILGLMEVRLHEAYRSASDEYDDAVVSAERRFAKERRVLEKANPMTAGSHFAELVAEDAEVAAAAAKMAEARATLETVREAKRGIVADSTGVEARQREVFATLIAEGRAGGADRGQATVQASSRADGRGRDGAGR